jgi:hypothetical protein
VRQGTASTSIFIRGRGKGGDESVSVVKNKINCGAERSNEFCGLLKQKIQESYWEGWVSIYTLGTVGA